MTPDKNSSDDLAKKGQQARIKRKQQEQIAHQKAKVSGKLYRQKRDQRNVFKHITRWSQMRGVVLQFCFVPLVCIPFNLLFWPGEMSTRIYISLLCLLISAVFILLFFYIGRIVKAKAIKEKEWIDSLPFLLIAYPDILVYRSYPTIYFTIKFKKEPPEVDYLLDVFATLPYQVTSKVEYKETDTVYKFEMTNDKASKFDGIRRWARLWIHDACNVQLTAIHKKYPINAVILNSGITELDFKWWIPMKQEWWEIING